MFIAHLNQGAGCDYTISCGESLITLKATTLKDAIRELKLEVRGNLKDPEHDETDIENEVAGYRGEFELESATLYEVVHVEKIPIKDWYKQFKREEEEQKKLISDKKEKEHYLKLKKKYG